MAAAVVVTFSLTLTQPAKAFIDMGQIWDAATSLAMIPVITFLQDTLFGSMKKGFSAIVKSKEASTKAVIESQSEQADAVYAKQGDRLIIERRIAATQDYQLAPAPCLTAGAAAAAKYAGAAQQAKTGAVLRQMTTNRMTTRNSSDSGLLRDFNQSSAYMPGGSVAQRDPKYLDADILASSLILCAGQTGKAKDETFDTAQEQAARVFISNATNGVPLPVLSPRQTGTDEGQKYIALQRAEAAVLSLPQYVFANTLSQSIKIPNLGRAMGTQWQSKLGVPNDISFNQFLSAEVNRRFANPGWYSDMSAGSGSAAIKERVYVDALYAKLQHMEIESLQRIELLLAQTGINNVASSDSHKAALNQFSRATATVNR